MWCADSLARRLRKVHPGKDGVDWIHTQPLKSPRSVQSEAVAAQKRCRVCDPHNRKHLNPNRKAWLLDDSHLTLQADLLGQAAGSNREAFIRALLERDLAVLRSSSPPPSKALIWAFDSGHAHLVRVHPRCSRCSTWRSPGRS
jgi:hypothetical protein